MDGELPNQKDDCCDQREECTPDALRKARAGKGKEPVGSPVSHFSHNLGFSPEILPEISNPKNPMQQKDPTNKAHTLGTTPA